MKKDKIDITIMFAAVASYVVMVLIIISALFVLFGGEPDLLDAIIYFLMK